MSREIQSCYVGLKKGKQNKKLNFFWKSDTSVMKRKTETQEQNVDALLEELSGMRFIDGEEELSLLVDAINNEDYSEETMEILLRNADERYKRYLTSINLEDQPLLKAGIEDYFQQSDDKKKYRLMRQIDKYIYSILDDTMPERPCKRRG